ncbi:sugar dehydrogenase complex small subunit [Erwinia sp. MMLR14_017]|uniref:sugar dehydrogenase complex small subunit n=1 Tax=Erwinia sp. MMLR14_017 TaxID=3093842 RepID=UPI0029906F56|nr:sugar dehydrogenase complex small subunit [Erwinia sp. MMLR14_017]MDW8847688.1 sugar dehydrogenase complex small subunit [Erwinia sp. MMLR14_017]
MSAVNSSPRSLSRRRLLQGMAVLSLSAACATLFPVEMAQAREGVESNFSAVSAFLVSRPVSPVLSQRYYQALQRHFKDFPQRLSALDDYLAAHAFTHVDSFLQAVGDNDPLRQTAALIIGSWYTGVVGEGAESELIAYSDAMMYLPTKGILVVPSYGGGPDSWGSKPASRQTNKGVTA